MMSVNGPTNMALQYLILVRGAVVPPAPKNYQVGTENPLPLGSCGGRREGEYSLTLSATRSPVIWAGCRLGIQYRSAPTGAHSKQRNVLLRFSCWMRRSSGIDKLP